MGVSFGRKCIKKSLRIYHENLETIILAFFYLPISYPKTEVP
jgi:hypothetical protein